MRCLVPIAFAACSTTTADPPPAAEQPAIAEKEGIFLKGTDYVAYAIGVASERDKTKPKHHRSYLDVVAGGRARSRLREIVMTWASGLFAACNTIAPEGKGEESRIDLVLQRAQAPFDAALKNASMNVAKYGDDRLVYSVERVYLDAIISAIENDPSVGAELRQCYRANAVKEAAEGEQQ